MKKFLAVLMAVLMLSAMALSVGAQAYFPLDGFAAGRGYVARIPMNFPGLPIWFHEVENETTGEGVTTVSAGYAKTGDVIKVTAAPAEGMALASLTVVDALGNVQALNEIADGVYTFVMPEARAIVKSVYADEIALGESGLTVVADGFVFDLEEGFADEDDAYLVAYYYDEATGMDFDVYEWAKEEGVTLEAAVLEESETYEIVEVNGYAVAVYTAVDEFEGESFDTVTYIIDAGDEFVEVVFYLDAEESVYTADAMIASLAAYDETNEQLGESGVAVVLPEGFALDLEEGFADEDDAYLVGYYYNEETGMDFDVYEWAKEEGVTLEDAVLEESETYEIVEINGYAVAVYTAVDEFEGESFDTVTYIIDAGDEFVEIVFYLDAVGSVYTADAMIATLA